MQARLSYPVRPPELPSPPALQPKAAETPPRTPQPGPGPNLTGLPPTAQMTTPPVETPAPKGLVEILTIRPLGPQMPQPVA